MRSILIISLVLLLSGVFAVDIPGQQVSGVVTAFKNIPLNRVLVKSIKAEKTVLTDSLGRFSIDYHQNDVIVVSAAGFVERKIRVRDNSNLHIDLKYQFDESSFNYAVAGRHINADVLKRELNKYTGKREKDYSHYQNIFDLIRSEIIGVRVSGTSVLNAKAISFSMSSQVLYVVDDMIVTDISYISPTTVQKIEFLEDNDASAFGIRGANGVIRITLKNK
jgi:hypothetical protein